MPRRKRICFVSGTRAEFGLMEKTLRAIRAHPKLELQLVVTGMHLDRSRGRTIDEIRSAGWKFDATVPWKSKGDAVGTAAATGLAMAALASSFESLKSDIVLVVGDRVEAFAAAAAAHVSGRVLAHVHGGDRAAGLVDDALRHAITKLAHLHFPATRQSAKRIVKLGEDRSRIYRVGSPGIEGIRALAAPKVELKQAFNVTPGRFALLVLHPSDGDAVVEKSRAADVLAAVRSIPFDRIVVAYPNNDPGASGIVAAWEKSANDPRTTFHRHLPRPKFLGLMRNAAVLVGNSSSGIIEAASFGTSVIDIGDRQEGRERSANCTHVGYRRPEILNGLRKVWNDGRPIRWHGTNVYGGQDAAVKITKCLAAFPIDSAGIRKLITY